MACKLILLIISYAAEVSGSVPESYDNKELLHRKFCKPILGVNILQYIQLNTLIEQPPSLIVVGIFNYILLQIAFQEILCYDHKLLIISHN